MVIRLMKSTENIQTSFLPLVKVATHSRLPRTKGSLGCRTFLFSDRDSPRQTEMNWLPYLFSLEVLPQQNCGQKY